MHLEHSLMYCFLVTFLEFPSTMEAPSGPVTCQCSGHLEKVELEQTFNISARKMSRLLFGHDSPVWKEFHDRHNNTGKRDSLVPILISRDGANRKMLATNITLPLLFSSSKCGRVDFNRGSQDEDGQVSHGGQQSACKTEPHGLCRGANVRGRRRLSPILV